MDIPINVDVFCDGEACGRSTCLIINPVKDQVTHFVVLEKTFPYVERLVPVGKIISSTPHSIQLSCSQAELTSMKPFLETDFIEASNMLSALTYKTPYMVWPYGMYSPMPLEHEHIPVGEVAIHRGTPVNATDGKVGKVDEFLVDPKDNDVITHLVLREGHLWDRMDVTIPVSEIDKITDEAVFLKIDKKSVDILPAISVERKWK